MVVKIVLVYYYLDVVICIGCVIKGEIKYDEYINNVVLIVLVNLGMVSGKFVIFGVLILNIDE